MAWFESVVRVARGGIQGSGVFVGPDLVLTAGHVVLPEGSALPQGNDLSVVLPKDGNLSVNVVKAVVHPMWVNGASAVADMALVRVEAAVGTPLPQWQDFSPIDRPIEIRAYGYPLLDPTGFDDAGFIDTREDLGHPGFWVFESSSLELRAGMSGGPFLWTNPTGTVYVVGIATYDIFDPRTFAPNGLPLRANTYITLLNMLRAEDEQQEG